MYEYGSVIFYLFFIPDKRGKKKGKEKNLFFFLNMYNGPLTDSLLMTDFFSTNQKKIICRRKNRIYI